MTTAMSSRGACATRAKAHGNAPEPGWSSQRAAGEPGCGDGRLARGLKSDRYRNGPHVPRRARPNTGGCGVCVAARDTNAQSI